MMMSAALSRAKINFVREMRVLRVGCCNIYTINAIYVYIATTRLCGEQFKSECVCFFLLRSPRIMVDIDERSHRKRAHRSETRSHLSTKWTGAIRVSPHTRFDRRRRWFARALRCLDLAWWRPMVFCAVCVCVCVGLRHPPRLSHHIACHIYVHFIRHVWVYTPCAHEHNTCMIPYVYKVVCIRDEVDRQGAQREMPRLERKPRL